MSGEDRLAEYRPKRDTTASGEPAGRGHGKGGDRFVVQRHDASTVHFDFRLEVDVVVWDTGTYRNLTGESRNKPESVLSGHVNEDFE